MSDKKALYIQGMEVTQAIQYYRSEMHLSDPLDRAPDNSARLVADKAAWVRVYVRSGSTEVTPDVTGVLIVEREIPALLLAELNPEPPGAVAALPEPQAGGAGIPFITPQTLYRWQRGDLAATLNFVIPSNLMCGRLRLTARVSAPDGQSHEMVSLLDARLHQRIRFRAIMLGYSGPDSTGTQITVAPPTLADLQTTSALTLLMNPVSSVAAYEVVDTRTLSTPLGPACQDNWDKVLKVLEEAAAADGDKPGCIYYGLMARDVPGQGGGCNWGTRIASFEGQPGSERVMAHEFGHAFQAHAPCGNPGGVDPNHPTYEPYDPASIGEYGLDINTGAVMSPETFKDLMSYCPPNVWISLYGHKLRTNRTLLNPTWRCDPLKILNPQYFEIDPKRPIPDPTFPFVPAAPRPIISILGTLEVTGDVTIENVFRGTSYAAPCGATTGLEAVLDGADGRPLAAAPLLRLSAAAMGPAACGCCDSGGRPPFVLKALLPDIAPGAALRVLKDGEEVWRRAAPSAPPRVTELAADIVASERLAVRWRTEGPEPDRLRYWVRWSGDHGQGWNALGAGILETHADFSLGGLPAGALWLQVIAHDGFFSVPSEPVTVAVPERSPIVTILHPREGAAIAAGSTLRLWAAVTGDGRETDSDDLRWLVDGREVGRGLEAWSMAPDAGEHRCTLRLQGDREGTRRTVRFTTVANPGRCRTPWSS